MVTTTILRWFFKGFCGCHKKRKRRRQIKGKTIFFYFYLWCISLLEMATINHEPHYGHHKYSNGSSTIWAYDGKNLIKPYKCHQGKDGGFTIYGP